MRSTAVPAQVTTVEDRVAGNLSFSQLVLFAVPVFGGALLYAILPPTMDIAVYKIIVLVVVAAISSTLAIRIKGKIVLLWLALLLRYGLRPKYYLFNKNTLNAREDYPEIKKETVSTTESTQTKSVQHSPRLNLLELNEVYAMLDDPATRIRFETVSYTHLTLPTIYSV